MIVLHEPSLQFWRQYQGGKAPKAGDDHAQLLASWARSRAHGVEANALALPVVVNRADLVARRDRAEELLAEGNATLERMRNDLNSQDVVAILTDPDGVVLQTGGGFRETSLRLRLEAGARWDERTRGTNAIGTAIALGQAVAMRGRAHFERGNHGLFCYASPIRDPHGNLLAVFDISGPIARDSRLFALAVQTTAVAVERALRLRSYASAMPGGFRVLESMLERCATPALILEPPGVVRRANERLLRALGLSRDLCEGQSVESVFGIPYEALRDEAMLPRHSYVSISTDTLRGHAELEPVLSDDGRVLAIVVYIEMERAVIGRQLTPMLPRTADLSGLARILGSDPQVSLARASAESLAREDAPLLIASEERQGETAFARAIHQASLRGGGPFVTVDGRSASEEDLFGEDGAFQRARGGTVFVMFAAELGKQTQTALFECIDNGTYRGRFGAAATRSEARILAHIVPAATRRSSELLKHNWYERFAGRTLTLPTLADRVDKVELSQGLLARICGSAAPRLAASARAWLAEQPWPSDLDTLEAMLSRAADSVGRAGEIDAEVLMAAAAASQERDKTTAKSRKKPA